MALLFERGPFTRCPACSSENAVGLLSVGGLSLTRRCTKCRSAERQELPSLNKKVIYLDQNALSEIYLTRSNTRRAGATLESFWREVSDCANRVFLLQQAIFPDSDIHRDETIVSPFSGDLRLAHELMSGDVSFKSSGQISMAQNMEFFEAYIAGRDAPSIQFDVKDIIDGDKDAWIPALHITVKSDFSIFADEIRAGRNKPASAFSDLLKTWSQNKPTFQQALKVEIESFGSATKSALRYNLERLSEAITNNDPESLIELSTSAISRQFRILRMEFESRGISKENSGNEVLKFWDWKGNQTQPIHKISSYLFAGLARRMASGQKKAPTIGIFNDFKTISTYAPYVDAMFLDRECATLLNEKPIINDLGLNTRIFSTKKATSLSTILKKLRVTRQNWCALALMKSIA